MCRYRVYFGHCKHKREGHINMDTIYDIKGVNKANNNWKADST